MVAVGDKLGGRYFVTKVDAKLAPGAFLEVRDAQSNVFYAQMLGAKAMAPGEVSALAREVASVSPMPTLFLPDEVTQDPAGVPFAVFGKAPADPLVDDLRLYESGGSKQRRAQTFRALTNAFAALADDLARGGGARSTHGAIAAPHLGAHGRDDTLRLELQGFGLDAAARIQARQERPTPRADAAGLFLTLHDLLTRTQSLPEGPALVKWNLLVTCARAGDHPALQHTAATGRFLRDVPAEVEATRENAPPRANAAPPEVSATASPAPAATPAARPKASFDLRAWVDDHRRAVIGGAAGLGLVAVAGVASTLMDGPTAAPPAPPARPATRRPAAADALPACTGESLQSPAAADLAPDGDAFESVCVDGSLRLVASGGANLTFAARSARRASRFAEPSSLVTGGRTEGGAAVAAGGHVWVAWRHERAVHVARAEAADGALVAELPGAWRGAWLLTAGEHGAWVAATLERPEGPLAVAILLPGGATPEAPRAFALGEGAIEAAVPGDAASLLLRKTQGRRHELSAITVTTSVLPVLAQAPSSDGGAAGAPALATVPDVSLQRTAAFTVEADRVSVAPTGVGRVGEARSFLVTEGEAGAVTLVTYPPQGAPAAERLTTHGAGLGLGANGRGEPVAVVAEGPLVALYTHAAGEAPAREPLRGLTRARVLACGDEPWLAFTAGAPTPRVAAVPLACVSRRALAR